MLYVYGKIKENYLKDAINEYSKRLSKYCSLNIVEISDEKLPDKFNSSIIDEIKEKECNKIIRTYKKRFLCNLFRFNWK